jgi:hypothetical protein
MTSYSFHNLCQLKVLMTSFSFHILVSVIGVYD